MVLMTKSNMSLVLYAVFFFSIIFSLNSLPVESGEGGSSEKIPPYSNCNPASLPNMMKNFSLNSSPVKSGEGESSEEIPSYSNCNPASLPNMMKNVSLNGSPMKTDRGETSEKITSCYSLPSSIKNMIKKSPVSIEKELPKSILNLRNNVIEKVLIEGVAVGTDVGCFKGCKKPQLDPEFNETALEAWVYIAEGDHRNKLILLVNMIEKSIKEKVKQDQTPSVYKNINEVIFNFTVEVLEEIQKKVSNKKTTESLT